jgi:hypothetical protein
VTVINAGAFIGWAMVISFTGSDEPGRRNSSEGPSVPFWPDHHPETVGRRFRVPI